MRIMCPFRDNDVKSFLTFNYKKNAKREGRRRTKEKKRFSYR